MEGRNIDPSKVFDGFYLEEGRNGEPVPIYWNRLCERAAIEAFLSGDWGALMLVEIEFMKEAAEEGRTRPVDRVYGEASHE